MHTPYGVGGCPSSWSPDPTACPIPLFQIRERLGVSLGERPPTLVPVTHVMMCMNCGCDFSLTLRRHHCHACGKVSPRRGPWAWRRRWVGTGGRPAAAACRAQSGACSHQPCEVNSPFTDTLPPGLQIPGPSHYTSKLSKGSRSGCGGFPGMKSILSRLRARAHQKNRSALQHGDDS